MSDAGPGVGNVTILLDGKEMDLIPTMDACLRISRIGGGLGAAVQRCSNLDMDTIVEVITAGLGINPTQAKMVPQAAFKTGLIALCGPCIDFIHIIGNGGRPIADDDDGGEGGLDPLRPASL